MLELGKCDNVLQQDGTIAHNARATTNMLKAFQKQQIFKGLWPP